MKWFNAWVFASVLYFAFVVAALVLDQLEGETYVERDSRKDRAHVCKCNQGLRCSYELRILVDVVELIVLDPFHVFGLNF